MSGCLIGGSKIWHRENNNNYVEYGIIQEDENDVKCWGMCWNVNDKLAVVSISKRQKEQEEDVYVSKLRVYDI